MTQTGFGRKQMKAFDDRKNDFYWKLLERRAQEKRIERIFRALNAAGIESLLIKGWAAARNYPQPFERLSVDVDAAVKPSDFQKSEKLLKEKQINGFDLHEGLRHLDKLDWEDLYAAAETVEIGGAPVKIPCAEDHLRILCVHWLGDGGANRERLWDIYYAVENRPARFDWTRCLDAAGEKRRKWIVCTIALTEKYLGLDLSGTPLAAETKRLPAWLIETVEREWRRGVRLKPLQNCLRNRAELLEQIKLRIPPNPIQATVDVEGAFDDRFRLPHQMGSILKRIIPSISRIRRALRQP